MEWLQIAPVVVSGLSIAMSIVYTIIIKVKQRKLKTTIDLDSENAEELKQEIERLEATQEVFSKIPQKIKESEVIFKNGNGAGKLAWCVSQLMLDVVKNDLDITETELTTKIEEILETPQKKQKTINVC